MMRWKTVFVLSLLGWTVAVAQPLNFLFLAEDPAVGELRLRLSGYYGSANAFYDARGQLVSTLENVDDTLEYQERRKLDYQRLGTEIEAEVRPWEMVSFFAVARFERFRQITTYTRYYGLGVRVAYDSTFAAWRFPTLLGGMRWFVHRRPNSRLVLRTQVVWRPQRIDEARPWFRLPSAEMQVAAEGRMEVQSVQLNFHTAYVWRTAPYNDLLALYLNCRLPVIPGTRFYLFARSVLSLLSPEAAFPFRDFPQREQWLRVGMAFHLLLESAFVEAGFSAPLWGKNVWNQHMIWVATGIRLPAFLPLAAAKVGYGTTVSEGMR